jgi:hypothetical protein
MDLSFPYKQNLKRLKPNSVIYTGAAFRSWYQHRTLPCPPHPQLDSGAQVERATAPLVQTPPHSCLLASLPAHLLCSALPPRCRPSLPLGRVGPAPNARFGRWGGVVRSGRAYCGSAIVCRLRVGAGDGPEQQIICVGWVGTAWLIAAGLVPDEASHLALWCVSLRGQDRIVPFLRLGAIFFLMTH